MMLPSKLQKTPLYAVAAVACAGLSTAASAITLTEMDIQQVLDVQRSGQMTCVQLAHLSLSAQKTHQDLKAFISQNTRLLAQARTLDQRRMKGDFLPLHCVPVAVKDNIDVFGFPTTGGSALMTGNFPARDATVVERLRKNGALIVGKTNLDELAIAGSTISSLGGQTLNPYDKTRFAAGSSGGSAVSVATGMAVCALGTETVNSLRNAASSSGVVAMRTTHGLVSRDGTIPISSSMDVVGPLCKSIHDIAAILAVVSGRDLRDPASVGAESLRVPISTGALAEASLKGKRFGILTNLFGNAPEHLEVNQAIAGAIQKMKNAGAEFVEIADQEFDSDASSARMNVSNYEFRPLFDSYLAGRKPLPLLADFNQYAAAKKFPERTMKGFIDNAVAWKNPLAMPKYIESLRAAEKLKAKIVALMHQEGLDALVYPAQKRAPIKLDDRPRPERNGVFASALGLPAIDLTAGFTPSSAAARQGLPVGLDLLGTPYGDLDLLSLARAVELTLGARKNPD